jgi:hypothetical protein
LDDHGRLDHVGDDRAVCIAEFRVDRAGEDFLGRRVLRDRPELGNDRAGENFLACIFCRKPDKSIWIVPVNTLKVWACICTALPARSVTAAPMISAQPVACCERRGSRVTIVPAGGALPLSDCERLRSRVVIVPPWGHRRGYTLRDM